MEDINPEKAIAAYLQSAEINIEEGKPRQSTDPYKKAISLLLRNNK